LFAAFWIADFSAALRRSCITSVFMLNVVMTCHYIVNTLSCLRRIFQ
jgi:hypothetical protein